MITPASPAVRGGLLRRHPDFRRLFGAALLEQGGGQVAGFVLPILAVTQLQATELQMGLLQAAETAAFLVIGLPAGAWVDRMYKRRVLVRSDLLRAAILAGIVVAVVTGHASMPLLYAAGLAMSAANVFFDVAHQSYVPTLVGLPNIVEGNSRLETVNSIAMIGGPALGGALLRALALPVVLASTVVTFASSAFLVSRIRHSEELPPAEDRRPLRTEIAEGLTWVVRQPILRRIVACTATSNLFNSAGYAVTTIFLLRTLGLTEAQVGLVWSIGAGGGLLGAATANRVAKMVGEGRVIVVTALATGAAYALTPLALLTGYPMVPLIAGGFAFNFFVVVYNIAQVSYRQSICPPALLGRMNASVRFIVWGTVPLGGLLGGLLGNTFGVLPTLSVAVAGVTLAALPVLLSPLRSMDRLPTP